MEVKRLHYMDILNLLDDFISLDISSTCTGYVIWKDKELEMMTGALASKVSDLEARVEFRSDLKEVFNGRQFKYAIVEDVIGGINFKTNKKLYQLNCIVDDMMYYGELPQAQIYRVDNSKWKKYMRDMIGRTPETKGMDDKSEIVYYMNQIGFYTDVQDVYDAMAMALSTLWYEVLRDKSKDLNILGKLVTDIEKFQFMFPTKRDSMSLEVLLNKTRTKYSCDAVVLRDEDIKSDLIKEIKAKIRAEGDSKIFVFSGIPARKLGSLCFRDDIVKRLDENDTISFIAVHKKYKTKTN